MPDIGQGWNPTRTKFVAFPGEQARIRWRRVAATGCRSDLSHLQPDYLARNYNNALEDTLALERLEQLAGE